MVALRRLLASFVILILLLAAMVFLMPKDRLAMVLSDEFSRNSGRIVTIEGPIRPIIWPVFGIATGPVTIENTDWGNAPNLLSAPSAKIGLDLSALLNGHIMVTGIIINRPEIWLEHHEDHQGNWLFDDEIALKNIAPERRLNLRLQGGRVHVAMAGGETVFEQVDLKTTLGTAQTALAATISAQFEGEVIDITATISGPSAFLKGQISDIALLGQSDSAKGSFQGRVASTPFEAEGTLTLDLKSPRMIAPRILPATDLLPDLPLSLSTNITRTLDKTTHFRNFVLTQKDQIIRADMDWSPYAKRPKFVAKMDFASLSLPYSLPPAMNAMDGEIALTGQSMTLGQIKMTDAEAQLNWGAKEAGFQLKAAKAYEGTFTGSFTQKFDKTPAYSADFLAQNITIGPFLQDSAQISLLEGQGNVQFTIASKGNNLSGFWKNLSGKSSVQLKNGRIMGLDLLSMLRTMDAGYIAPRQSSAFKLLKLDFNIKNGIMTNDVPDVYSNQFGAEGQGEINLPQGTISYRLIAHLLDNSQNKAPVFINGPINQPQMTLDVNWITQQREQNERARQQTLEQERLNALSP